VNVCCSPGQIVCVEYKGVPGYIGRFRCVETRYSKGINVSTLFVLSCDVLTTRVVPRWVQG
jgi:hypothetical protein